MADKPTISQIIEAINGASGRDLKKLRTALKAQGITSGRTSDSSGADYGKKREDVFAEIGKKGADMANSLKETFKAALGPTNQIRSGMQGLADEFVELRKQSELFTKAGYDKSLYNFDKAISAAADRSLKLTGNLKAQQEATSNLMSGFQAAAFTGKKFREEIFETATSLQAAGFDTNAYASILDTATMSMNLSEDEIKGLTASLVDLQKQFALSPKKMMQDYDYFAKNFAYSTGRLNENFAKLQKMSRMTGVDFRQLTESFGENMDTFEGSAQMAGRLNQILGKSMFNSIDLLGKTEAERAEVIRQGIQERFGGRIGDLKKFELKAIAAQLKMSPDEAKRFLRGEAPKAAKELDKLKDNNPAQIMKKMGGDLTKEMGHLSERIRQFQTPYERSLIEITNAFRQGIKTSTGINNDMAAFQKKFAGSLLGGGEIAGLGAPSDIKNITKAIATVGKTIGEKGNAVGTAMTLTRDAFAKLRKGLNDATARFAGRPGAGAHNAASLRGHEMTAKTASLDGKSNKAIADGASAMTRAAVSVENLTKQLQQSAGEYRKTMGSGFVGPIPMDQGSQQ